MNSTAYKHTTPSAARLKWIKYYWEWANHYAVQAAWYERLAEAAWARVQEGSLDWIGAAEGDEAEAARFRNYQRWTERELASHLHAAELGK